MLPLDNRLQVAMRADMGIRLEPDEVKLVAGWLVTLRQIAEGHRLAKGIAATALGKYKI
jgi:hypothetical protein